MYGKIWIVPLFVVWLVWPTFAKAAEDVAQQRLVNVQDFDKLVSVSAPDLSPDGAQVAYTARGQVFVVATDGGQPRAVTSSASKARSPTWSADGTALYFLSDRSGSSQLWKLPVDVFGEAVQLTSFEAGLDKFNLSPDETRLLLSR